MANPDTNNIALLREYEDRKIEQEIHRKLSAIITWDASGIQVEVHEGTAFLTGTVADTKSLEQTVLVVFTVKGVRQIDNKVTIRREGGSPIASRTTSDIESMTGNDGREDKRD